MSALTIAGEASITSQQIADLVEKRHDNVRRTIETLAEQGVIRSPQIEEIEEINNLGLPRKVKAYRFSGERGKRDSIVVVAQLSPEFTARLVDRWQELEARMAQPVVDPMKALADPAALRGLLLSYSEKMIVLEGRVAEQAPKVEVHDRIAAAEGSLCMRDAAKALQVRPVDLKNWLIANRWIYGRPGHAGWLAYQERIQQGVMIHKVTTVQREDGTEKIVEQARITPKGLAKIGHELSKVAA